MPEADSPLTILYADHDLIVVDKPAGLLSVPGRGADKQDSVQTRIAATHPGAVAVHRLDMCTSGIILIAKHKDAERHYKRQFEQRRVHKTYHAIIHGCPDNEQGNIDLPLTRDWPNRPKQKICLHSGKPALTHYHILHSSQAHSRVHLTPHTGRSHQLRIHLAAIGHPIIGDTLYGYPDDQQQPRLLLHACALSITTPNATLLELHSPTPF